MDDETSKILYRTGMAVGAIASVAVLGPAAAAVPAGGIVFSIMRSALRESRARHNGKDAVRK